MNEKDNVSEINFFIETLLTQIESSISSDSTSILFDSFYAISLISSRTDLNFESLFFQPPFFAEMIRYLFLYKSEPLFAICHNIIADPNFNEALYAVIKESEYIQFFIENSQSNPFFLLMLNILIFKTKLFDYDNLLLFRELIPFLLENLNSSLISKDNLLIVKSLKYLISFQDCLDYSIQLEIWSPIQHSIISAECSTFCQSLDLLMIVSMHHHDILIDHEMIVPLVSHHMSNATHKEIESILNYLFSLINSKEHNLFFESNLINELIEELSTSPHQKKLNLTYFFVESFFLIHDYYVDRYSDKIPEAKMNLMNTLLSHILEMSDNFKGHRCIVALSFIDQCFAHFQEICYELSQEIDFCDKLARLSSNDSESNQEISEYARTLLNKYFSVDD